MHRRLGRAVLGDPSGQAAPGVNITRADTDSCAVLRISGTVLSSDGPRLSTVLAKAMADNPTCVVCEMSKMTWLDPACIAIWIAAQWSGPWPGPVVWLTGPQGQPADALRAAGAARFIRLADSDEAVRAQQPIEPPGRRERLLLAAAATAAGRARRFTAGVLDLWALPYLTEDATLIVSELVTNAVQHAGSDLELRLEYGHDLLHIAVRDHGGLSSHPHNSDARPLSANRALMQEHGRGLGIVRTLATASGQTAAPRGGSVYWATLRTDVNAERR